MSDLSPSEIAALKEIAAEKRAFEEQIRKERDEQIEILINSLLGVSLSTAKQYGRYFFEEDGYWHRRKFFSCHFVTKYYKNLPVLSKDTIRSLIKISKVIYKQGLTEAFK